MHKSVIVDYIEELYYVDYLTDFRVYLYNGNGESREVDQIRASRARSVITTYTLKDPLTKLEHEIYPDL
jgi:regulator of protease activity HflC (stomatin/prohibitin superfamily)